MTNREVSRILARIADILEIKEDNPFKVRAYRNAADVIFHLSEDLKVIYQAGRLRDIPGVGKSVQAGLEELFEKGRMNYYERLLEEVPPGVLDMLNLSGIGHKTVRLIHKHLGIESLADLEKAAREQRIRQLPGLGQQTELKIIKGLELLRKSAERATLGWARPLAMDLLDYLEKSAAVSRAAVVGSIRRGRALVGDIDLLVSAPDEEALKETVKTFPGLKEISCCSGSNIKGTLRWDLAFDIILVPLEDFIPALFWTTGSKSFREALLPGGRLESFKGLNSEEDIFTKMGMQYIPPEMRENQGEISLARRCRLPCLVEQQDIKGDLHVHTSWSDGSCELPELARAAREVGYKYLGITDHSKSLHISGGLSEERLLAQGSSIKALNHQLQSLALLRGIEVDILKDGQLDYPNTVLDDLELVIASIHSNFQLDKKAQTERILQAIKNPRVNVIGHLTGRLLNRRPGYEVDIDRILEAASQHQVALEINSHPERLDIDEVIAARARECGVKVAVNSDAHDLHDLSLIHYGVINARRAWLEKGDIINCWELPKLRAFLQKG